MKKRIVFILMTVICVLLQGTVFQWIAIASIKPNLLVLVTVAIGLLRGKKSGALTGFFMGLLTDVCFSRIIGFEALLYLWIGYFSGYFYRIFYDDDIKTPILLISVGDLAYGLFHYGITFLLRGRIDFFFYLGRIILPEMMYTLVLTIVLYRLLYWINKKIGGPDKRSVTDFA